MSLSWVRLWSGLPKVIALGYLGLHFWMLETIDDEYIALGGLPFAIATFLISVAVDLLIGAFALLTLKGDIAEVLDVEEPSEKSVGNLLCALLTLHHTLCPQHTDLLLE